MSQLTEYVRYLAQDIGPRPAGTEEEQQAALYIADKLNTDAGFHAAIEDFTIGAAPGLARALCCAALLVAGVCALAVPFPAVGVVAVVVSLAAAVVFAAEAFGKPLVSRLFGGGVSQNVVAQYQPALPEGSVTRARKVILVAHYDSGKAAPAFLRRIEALPVPWGLVSLIAVIVVPVGLLIRQIAGPGTGLALFVSIFVVLALVVCAVLVARQVVLRLAPYSDGANVNASGVGVLMEVARRIGTGRVGADEDAAVTIQGEEAAHDAGLVPEGAQLVYEASQVEEPSFAPRTAEERLASAKAAIAAFTGKPGATWQPSDIARNLVQIDGKSPENGSGEPDDSEAHGVRYEADAGPLEEAEDDASAGNRLSGSRAGAAGAVGSAPSELPEHASARAESARDDTGASELNAGRVAAPEEGAALERSRRASLAQEHSEDDAAEHGADMATAAPSAGTEYATEEEASAPAWFRKARRQAKRSKDAPRSVHRSRYADALDAAENAALAAREKDAGAFEARIEGGPAASADAVTDGTGSAPASATYVVPTAHERVTGEGSGTRSDAETNVLSIAPQASDQSTVSKPASDSGSSGAEEQDRPLEGRQGAPEAAADEVPATPVKAHKEINVPAVLSTAEPLAPARVPAKQRAPLASAEESGASVAKGLLSTLPSIDVTAGGEASGSARETVDSPSKSGIQRSLRSLLPSFSGPIAAQGVDAASSVSSVGSFSSVGETGSFAPVGDELIADADPDDIYVVDADDSGIEENYTESGAFAGPGYVDMPKSRFRRMFDTFHIGRGKQEELRESPQEWLDVEDSFDPRETGRARGGWESFRDDGAYDDGEHGEGADASPAVEPEEKRPDGGEAGAQAARRARRWNGGSFSRVQLGRVDTASGSEGDKPEPEEHVEPAVPEDLAAEVKQIHEFRTPGFNTEVWFVALGSEMGRNEGMRTFLAAHEDDTRGAIVIDLEGLGAGTLSLVKEQGLFKKVRTSSRMRRYVQKASRASGIKVDANGSLNADTACSVFASAGAMAMHLAGLAEGAIAYGECADDVMDNVDEEILEENASFTVELVKAI